MHFIDDEHLVTNNHFEDNEDVEFLIDDMVLSREQMDALFSPEVRRNAVVDPELLWPDKTVPVFISNDFSESRESNDQLY